MSENHQSSRKEAIEHALSSLMRQGAICPVVPLDLNGDSVFAFNLTNSNTSLKKINILDSAEFFAWSDAQLAACKTNAAIGLFDEDRNIYARSELFGGDEPRTVHLGMDITVPVGTPVHAPLDATVHSFANNAVAGNYGPTVILKHAVTGITFYTLYGHLSEESLQEKVEGEEIGAGEAFAWVGGPPSNGNWPPHLHFQVICDIGEYKGDFPGVCTRSDRDKMLAVCINPNQLLGINWLGDSNRYR